MARVKREEPGEWKSPSIARPFPDTVRDMIGGYYLVADPPSEGYARVAELNRRFEDLALGVVDAAIVALAQALGLSRIATTDRRHVKPLGAALSLELLP